MRKEPTLDDTDPMPFGEHQGKPMSDVPARYFHYLWTKRPLSDPRVENYIHNNLSALRMEYRDGIWS